MPRLAVLLAFAMLAVSAAFAGAQNLAPNPGFEAGLAGWELVVGPESRGVGAVTEAKAAADAPHGGQASARMNTDVRIRYTLSTDGKAPIPVVPGQRYRVGAWVKVAPDAVLQPGQALVYLRLALMEAPGQSTRDPRGNLHVGLAGTMARTADLPKLAGADLPGEWRKIEGVVEIPPGQAFVAIGLFVERVVGAVYWDDVVLEGVDPSTPLSPEAAK